MTRRTGEAARRKEVFAQILAAGESVKALRILTASILMSNRTENFNFVKWKVGRADIGSRISRVASFCSEVRE